MLSVPTPRAWDVVVPLKDRAVAKSRLRAVGEPARAELALAMAADVVAAAVRAEGVGRVLAVTDDEEAAALLAGLGAQVLRGAPAGLDPALAAAAARCGPRVAALCADLPCVRPGDLAAALGAVPGGGRGAVVDAAGTGTTLLAADGVALAPAFGPGSAARHRALGAVALPAGARLRLDVDTPEDLARALAVGAGPATAAVCAALRSAS